MLIQTRETKWVQDPGVADLIDYFDDVERKYLARSEKERSQLSIWDTLTKNQREIVGNELWKVRGDFTYCARNYFWIIDRDSEHHQKKLFSLWEAQELVLDYMNALKAKGKAQKVYIIKGRRLGMSTLFEAKMAHSCFFNENVDAMIVSYDKKHVAYQFGLLQSFYDGLPWWMKPMVANREWKDQIVFDNPDPNLRRTYPGLNSRIFANTAEGHLGVGQGMRLVAFHGTEVCDWPEDRALEIIEEDIEHAIPESPGAWGALESTAKGAGNYSHNLWLRMEAMAERARWMPIFLPIYFDSKKRSVVVPSEYQPDQRSLDILERAKNDWVRCDNSSCKMYHKRVQADVEYLGQKCSFCGDGTFSEYTIPIEQLHYLEEWRRNCEKDPKALEKLRQELAVNSQECFILSGLQLFSDQALAYAQSTVRDPIAKGFLTRDLRFHGVRKTIDGERCWCEGCGSNHVYDGDSLLIWEFPHPRCKYVVGVDTADGLGGTHDYTVVQVMRIGEHGHPDAQVATFARNDVDPDAFAVVVDRIARYYNDAVLAPETVDDSGAIVMTLLRVRHNYPNIYKPINPLSLSMDTTQLGWKTNEKTKGSLYNSLRSSLNTRSVIIRDKATVDEIHTFRKEKPSKSKMEAITGHDDRVVALMIANYIIHEQEWDPDGGAVRYTAPMTIENSPVLYRCLACGVRWPAKEHGVTRRCPECGNFHIESQNNKVPDPMAEVNALFDEAEYDGMRDYHSL